MPTPSERSRLSERHIEALPSLLLAMFTANWAGFGRTAVEQTADAQKVAGATIVCSTHQLSERVLIRKRASFPHEPGVGES